MIELVATTFSFWFVDAVSFFPLAQAANPMIERKRTSNVPNFFIRFLQKGFPLFIDFFIF